jgi:hypothetical protein
MQNIQCKMKNAERDAAFHFAFSIEHFALNILDAANPPLPPLLR